MTKAHRHKVKKMSQVHGGNVWKITREEELSLRDIIDFSANINPLGISPKAEAAIRDNINKIIHCNNLDLW